MYDDSAMSDQSARYSSRFSENASFCVKSGACSRESTRPISRAAISSKIAWCSALSELARFMQSADTGEQIQGVEDAPHVRLQRIELPEMGHSELVQECGEVLNCVLEAYARGRRPQVRRFPDESLFRVEGDVVRELPRDVTGAL